MMLRNFNAVAAKCAVLPLDDSPKLHRQINVLQKVCGGIVKSFYKTRSPFVYFGARPALVNLEETSR